MRRAASFFAAGCDTPNDSRVSASPDAVRRPDAASGARRETGFGHESDGSEPAQAPRPPLTAERSTGSRHSSRTICPSRRRRRMSESESSAPVIGPNEKPAPAAPTNNVRKRARLSGWFSVFATLTVRRTVASRLAGADARYPPAAPCHSRASAPWTDKTSRRCPTC